MKKLPLVVQLVVILFVILLIPCTILTLYSTRSILDYSQEELGEYEVSNLRTSQGLTEEALSNIVKNVQRVVYSFDFNTFKNIRKYESIQLDVSKGKRAQDLQSYLNSIVRTENLVYSAFFHINDSDYVVSTDRGVVTTENYTSLNWLRELPIESNGVSGTWIARELGSATLREVFRGSNNSQKRQVYSYIYPLNKLTTSTNGIIVVNVDISQLSKYINHGHTDNLQEGSFLFETDGTIITHPDKNMFLNNLDRIPNMAELLISEQPAGYAVYEQNGSEFLYAYLQSPDHGKIYASLFSIDSLSQKAFIITRNVIILMIVVIFLAAVLSVYIAFRISQPMRNLTQTIRKDTRFQNVYERNEISFLSQTFYQFQKQEKELSEQLRQNQKDSAKLALQNLLAEELAAEQDIAILRENFPHPFFAVILTSPDGYIAYRAKTSPELRDHHHNLFLKECEDLLSNNIKALGIRYGKGKIAFILNLPDELEDDLHKIYLHQLEEIQKIGNRILGCSFTLGISQIDYEFSSISTCAKQADIALQRRIIEGKGQIYTWSSTSKPRKKFLYDSAIEDRILHCLDNGNFELLSRTLTQLKERILQTTDITYDNIYFIYNQLISISIRHLAGKNIHTSVTLTAYQNIYADLTSLDTLNDMETYITEFYREILDQIGNGDPEKEKKYLNEVLEYLENHYKEDIYFEGIASKLGISYSYLRKIIRDNTGSSMLDYINRLRIEDAKNQLIQSSDPISTIAETCGYRNIQSFNRFFKKFEGVQPREYRQMHSSKQNDM